MQREWDSALLAYWQRDFYRMGILIARFLAASGMSMEEFRQLKRVPRPDQTSMPVRGFVAQALPALSDKLWDGKHTREQLLDWMESARLRTAKPRSSIFTEARKEEKQTRRLKRVDVHKGHRRSDWNVCKG